MCLTIDSYPFTFGRTEKEEVYYKVLYKICEESNIYLTPFQKMSVTLGDEQIVDGTDFEIESCGRHYEIGDGGFHLFKRKSDADWQVEMLLSHPAFSNYMFYVVKAVVPEGTPYIEGKYGEWDAVVVKKVRYEKLEDELCV